MTQHSRSILVIGTHRSGTSLVAGMLHRLGVFMGEAMLGESDANPRGHYEDYDWLYLNDRVVGDWKKPRVTWRDDQLRHYYAKLAKTKQKRLLWGAKDPRFCFTAKYLLPHLRDPKLILTHRNQADSTASLAERENISLKEATKIQQRYLDARDKLVSDFPVLPKLNVYYEGVLSHPDTWAQKLASFCIPTEYAAEFVDASLDNTTCKA